mmetsp:Transcript_1904/g.3618  ORF Transcript_1904/g.3618 Transcript_1904/m.3618 type:complete len:237 (-) Transcript_1904:336-1046(-)
MIMLFYNIGNCKNCQHPVNAHPRSSAVHSQPVQPIHASANVVHASAISDGSISKGHLISKESEQILPGQHVHVHQFQQPQGQGQAQGQGQGQHNPLVSQQVPQQQKPVIPLNSIPLDHSGSHIPQYDPKTGGYVSGTGTVTNNECTQGNYNNNGLTGPGVNNTVQSTGSVAYGGALGSQYEGGYYSAKRVTQTESSAPVAQQVDVKVVSSVPVSSSEEFDYGAMRAQYGNGYSAKR